MSTDATPAFDNADMAQAVESQFEEKRTDENETAVESNSTRREILDSFKGKVVHVRLAGNRLEFETLSPKDEDWLEETGIRFSDIDEETALSRERQDEYLNAKDRMVELLAENAVDDQFDLDFWKQVPKKHRQAVLESLLQGGIEGQRAKN